MAWEKLCTGALCAASGLALPLVLASQYGSAQCYDNERQGPAASAAAAAAAAERDVAALTDWLRQQGADVDAVEFKQSDKEEGRYGVYAGKTMAQRAARSWLGTVAGWVGRGRNAPVEVAAFPLSTTLTAANLARHPQQGATLQELMQLGVADERTAVILHLAVERQRLRLRQGATGGGSSASSAAGSQGSSRVLLPWLALLPDTFGTTLYFSELDLQWLRGTTLYKATRLRQKSLLEAWRRLAPAAAQLGEQSGLPPPSFEDWVWANSIFWSRAIAFPGPTPGGGVEMQEGIVPGLDFCNHASPSPCYWTISAAAATLKGGKGKGKGHSSSGSAGASAGGAGEQPAGAVSLVCPRSAVPAAGQEVTIDYGGKSNEELMFLYGFALEDNPSEVLTLMCPLPPPGEWNDLLRARLLLLQRRGLRPQLHLPAADLARLGGSEAAKDARAARRGGVIASDLPDDVLETLEVFVMAPSQVQQELEASEAEAEAEAEKEGEGSSIDGGAAGSRGGGSEAGRGQAWQQRQRQQQVGEEAELSGQRMALLTTLVRLLELKALEMEGREEGTGPLESDQQLLAGARDVLPRNQLHALLYRMGQKALARAYVAHAKRLLQQEMAHLARLQRG